MWYLKVSSSLLIAVALICMIQNAISLAIDQQASEDKWSTLASSTDQNDLKKISKLCKISLNNFNEKLENTKTIANKKLPEPNKTTEDIANLVSEIKTQVKNASADLVNVRKLVQKTALRFRDTFKSLVSFTELESDSVNKELESLKKTAVDNKKPLVNRVIRSFGNRYDLNKLANKVLEITSDREKLKNNYDEKKKIAKREFNSLWNSLSNHSKTVNDNALKALDTFFEGMKSVKSVKKKVKTIGEDALNEIKVGDDIIKLKNAVELAKALKLKFEDEWNLDSGELTYSEEQKKPNTEVTDENQTDVQESEQDKNENENVSMDDIQPKTKQETNENDITNVVPTNQDGIEKLPMDKTQTSNKPVSPIEETQLTTEPRYKDEDKTIQPTISETEKSSLDNNVPNTLYSPIEENPLIRNTENKDKAPIVQPELSNKNQNSINNDALKSDSSIQNTSFNSDINTKEAAPLKESKDNKRLKRIKKRTSRGKTLILPWEKLIQLDNPQVSQQSTKCEKLLNDVTPDFDDIKKAAKNSIPMTKTYKNLQKIENDTVKRFYDKMVDTNTKLRDYLVNAADDVCEKVTPAIYKRYETKFKNDPNIKRIKYLLGKQYDPNQYILKILDDANHKNGIDGIKKTTYYKMLAVAHNLNHETKEMENAALYAMNKIHEGKLAATDLRKMFNKEKASKACYIRNILLEQEKENEKKNKDENKEKLKESINEETNTEPFKPDVDLDSVDAIQQLTVSDDNEQIIKNNKETNNYPRSSIPQNNEDKQKLSEEYKASKEENDNNFNKSGDIKSDEDKESDLPANAGDENSTEIPEKSESEMVDSKELDANHDGNDVGNMPGKHIVKRRRKVIDPKDGKEISEEYETEEDDNDSNKSGDIKSDEEKDSDLPANADAEHSTEIPEKSESEMIDSKEGDDNHDGNDVGNMPGKHKVKRRRKVIDPKDGKEISEEYETEEDDNDLNKSGDIKSDEEKDSDFPVNGNAEHSTEIPEKSESEMVDSKEGDANHDGNDVGNMPGKHKVKRRRKVIDPKDGKEISEEYETEEDDNDLNKSGDIKSDEEKDSDFPVNGNAEHSTEIPEKPESEMIDSKEGDATHDGNDEGNMPGKHKVKRRRKVIDPKDGKEISEEYETEEDDNDSNKSGDIKSDKEKDSDLPANADAEHSTEITEKSESEMVDSKEGDANHDGNDVGNMPGKHKVKRRRKVIDPKDGKEISEEYETEEDDNDLNKSGDIKSDEEKDSDFPVNGNAEHSTEIPEKSESEMVDSKEGDATHDGNDEGNMPGKHKVKRRRKVIDPKDGKEISEEYETEEDDNDSNKSGDIKSDEEKDSDLPANADAEHSTEITEKSESEMVDSKEGDANHDGNDVGNMPGKHKVKRRRKVIDPKDGKEISEEYETEEDDNDSNKSGDIKSDEEKDSDLPANADAEHSTEIHEKSESEMVDSKEGDDNHDGNDVGNMPGKHKVKRRRKVIDPKDGKEISEEYETVEDDNDLNKSGDIKSDEEKDSDFPVNGNAEHSTEIPEKSESEMVDSKEGDATHDGNDVGNMPGKHKVKRRRKVIDPKDGKEISEEYETEEDDNDLKKSGDIKSDEEKDSDFPVNGNAEHSTEIPEKSESEMVDSKEGDATHDGNDVGNMPGKHKVKRRRKVIDPKDGKEISEEYETEEDDNDLNKSGDIKSDEEKDSDFPVNGNAEHSTEIPEKSESEMVDSKEGDATHDGNDVGNMPGKHKVKRRRKVIDPKDGKEISEEYETEEDDNDLNKSGDIKSDEEKDSDFPVNGNAEHSTEIPEKSESEMVDSKEGDATHDGNDVGNMPGKHKVKRRRKVIDPKDGKEISEEYETEEDDNDLNKSGDIKSDEEKDSDFLVNGNAEHSTEIPEKSESEMVDSKEGDATHDGNDEGNMPGKHKVKRRRKVIDPKDGKEISEEYETEEDDNDSNKSGDIKSDEEKDSDLPANADAEHSTEITEKSESKMVVSKEGDANHDGNDVGNMPGKHKVKRRRKFIDPKDGKEISEEYETEEDDNDSNKSGDIKSDEEKDSDLPANADAEHSTEIHEKSESEMVDSKEGDATHDGNDVGNMPGKHKVKRRRKVIDPKDGKEISEEYETEEDDNDLNKSSDIKSDEEKDSDFPVNGNAEHSTEIPEKSESEMVDSKEGDATHDGNDVGNMPGKHKVKRRRKVIDPKDGKEISEEYETEEDDNDLNKSGDIKSDEEKDSDFPVNGNAVHSTEIPEKSESEMVDSKEGDATHDGNDVGNMPGKHKVKRRRKVIDPKDGKEISEEYETEEDDNDSNKSGDIKSDEEKDSDLPANGNAEHSTEIPEKSESEMVDSKEGDDNHDGNDVGNKPGKPKVKRRRKVIDPKDGKEISEEYETEEDDNDLNKSIEENADTLKQDNISYERSRDLKPPPSIYNEASVDPENTTKGSVELEENENLNSVDGEEMNCVYNDNITSAAESMGEDSSSQEGSYENPDQNDSNYSNNNYKNKNRQDVTEDNDSSEGPGVKSAVVDKNISSPLGTSDNKEFDSETPEYKKSNEKMEKIDSFNKPGKKMKRKKKQKAPWYDQEESGEYETIEDNDIDDIYKLKPKNLDSNDQFDESQSEHKPKCSKKNQYPEYDYEESEEYDSLEEMKKHNLRPKINEGNIDLNNNVIPHKDNYLSNDENNNNQREDDQGINSEPSPYDGYNVQDTIPETENEEPTDIEQPELSENEVETPQDSTPYDNDGSINNAPPRPRKIRRRRKSRKPESVNENDNEPEVGYDENNNNHPEDEQGINSEPSHYDGYNVQDTIPETENEEPTDIEQPELSENEVETPEDSTPYDNDGSINNATPRPRKIRRRRKSRKPEVVNENDNEPEVGYDENNNNHPEDEQGINSEPSPYDGYKVQDTIPETENEEPTDIEQPELSENEVETPEDSTPYDNDGSINNAPPRPRKIRRRRKSRKPESVNENDNEPEVGYDENNNNHPEDEQGINSEPSHYDGYNVQDTIPETENEEPTDIEQPELSENEVETPEDSTPYDNDGSINNATPRPRKIRRRRKSRKPESVNENDNEPEVGYDENNNNHPEDEQGINSEPSPYDGYNVQDIIPETENEEPTDIEQPELSENEVETPEDSTPHDNDGSINNATPRPRKIRRRRKSRKPEAVNENDNEPEVGYDENNNYHPEDEQGINSEPSPYDGYNVQDTIPETENEEPTDIEQPELSENEVETPEDSTPYDNDGSINNAPPRPRKIRRRRKSRKPEAVNENDNEPEVGYDENNNYHPEDEQGINSEPSPYGGYNVQDTIPETENEEPTDIEQPELSENDVETPGDSTPYDNDGSINNAPPRPRKIRRRRKSRKPEAVNENDNEPEVGYDENNNNLPEDDQGINSEPSPYDFYNVQDTIQETENEEPTDIEQPELSENEIETPEVSNPYDNDGSINNAKPRPRKIRRGRKSRKPEAVNENDNEPEVGYDENNNNHPEDEQGINSEPSPYDGYNVQDAIPETENEEPTDIQQPELSENEVETPEDSTPHDNNGSINNGRPRPRKIRRRRKSRKPEVVNENDNEPEVGYDKNDNNHPEDEQGINSEPSPYDGYNVQDTIPETENEEPTDIQQPELSENEIETPGVSNPYDNDRSINNARPRPRKIRRRRKSRKPKSDNDNDNSNSNNYDTEKSLVQNDKKSEEIPETKPYVSERNPKKKRHVRHIRTYMVNRATNERIPINYQTYTTTDGLPDTPKSELEPTEIEDSNDSDTNKDIDDYSSFLFKEYNSDQCKRDAYDRFKKVTSQDAKQIAYRSVLDTSEMRSNMLATIKNALSNVKISKTFNDVDQSLRTVSSSLKYSLKQTVGDLVTKVIPLAKDFLKTTENLKELYKNGPQSTHKMLSNVLENESTVPDSAKDVLKLISPQFDVDKLINNIFDKPFNKNSLKEKKAKAQRKLIDLSKHMDTAISNIDCFVLSAMSSVGIGADTLKLLKSGRVIMSDKHPRAKALRDALGIIKSGKKIRNNDVNFSPTLTSDGTTKSDEDDDDEDPDEVAQKNEEFLKTVPDIDDDMPVPKKVKNKRRSLGVIVVHPDKQIEYKEVNDTSQLKKFVGEQTKKYKLQSKNKHPKFLKLNSKKLIDNMVKDVKKKAERNGMSKKEMVQEIINNLKSN